MEARTHSAANNNNDIQNESQQCEINDLTGIETEKMHASKITRFHRQISIDSILYPLNLFAPSFSIFLRSEM